ncbi:MAG: sugar nucleotide-binding protein, partial [Bacteroidales bacterium]
MNILIIGANGQLGNEMRNVSEKSSDHYVFTDVTEAEGLETLNLDITDSAAVEKTVLDLSVNVIVNCAAFTNV